MKLRLLNGAHSAIAYLGLLSGHATVDRAFADPAIRQFVDALWAEAIPTLPEDAGLDTAAYTAELAERFSNTALAHRTAQIANDGSQKLPQRIIASAIECLEAGTEFVHLTLVVAAWIAACAARGKTLPESHFTDPLDARADGAFEPAAAGERNGDGGVRPGRLRQGSCRAPDADRTRGRASRPPATGWSDTGLRRLGHLKQKSEARPRFSSSHLEPNFRPAGWRLPASSAG